MPRYTGGGGVLAVSCAGTAVQHAFLFVVGFFGWSPVNEKLGSFRHFPHRLPNGFVP
jgi:hypothetical protein